MSWQLSNKEITERNVGRKSSYGLLNVRVDYRRAFGPIDVTALLDVINATNGIAVAVE